MRQIAIEDLGRSSLIPLRQSLYRGVRQDGLIGRERPKTLIEDAASTANLAQISIMAGLGVKAILHHRRFDSGLLIQILQHLGLIAVTDANLPGAPGFDDLLHRLPHDQQILRIG